MEGPVHGEEDVVVDHLGLVVQPRLLRLQAHHVHDLRDPEAPAPVRPNHLSGWDRKTSLVIRVLLLRTRLKSFSQVAWGEKVPPEGKHNTTKILQPHIHTTWKDPFITKIEDIIYSYFGKR